MFRKATVNDIDAVTAIFDRIHDAEERGEFTIGWQRGVYPTRETAEAAVERDDLFVEVDDGTIVAVGIINKIQVDVYADANWEFPAGDDEVMVLHTLTVDPVVRGKGYGPAFARFYEEYARENNCPYLRIDTNERNTVARKLYRKLGYKEIGIIPCKFNGIPEINLVLLEKSI